MKNYYKILGIQMDAEAEEIKHAYKSLIKIYDPQLHAEDRYSYERYQNITIAFNTLMNPSKREDYDRILKSILSPAEIRELHKAKQATRTEPKEPMESTKGVSAKLSADTSQIPSSLSQPSIPQAPRRIRPFAYIAATLVLLIVPGFLIFQMGKTSSTSETESLAWNAWKRSDSPALQNEEATSSSNLAIENFQREEKHQLANNQETKNDQPVQKALAGNGPLDKTKEAHSSSSATSPSHVKAKELGTSEESVAPPSTKKHDAPSRSKAADLHHIASTKTEVEKELVPSETLPLGTSQVDVLKKQGTPSTIVRYGADQETWLYLDGSIHFRNGKMISYNSEHKTMDFPH